MRDQQSTKPSDKPQEGEAAVQKLWEEAAEDFRKICGESLNRGDIKTFEDVRTTIEAMGGEGGNASSDAAHSDDWREKTKSVGLQCLHYLSVLVPAPQAAVTMVSNALCFVFDIPQQIANYAAAIHTVFAKISSALAQVNIYKSMNRIDPALVKQIHLVMTSFVKLSAHVVKYKQPARKRDKVFDKLVKVGLLHGDKGLNDEMTEFERVLQQQRDVEGTVTLSVAVKTDQNVAMLMDWSTIAQKTAEVTQQGVQALQNESDRAKQLKYIKEILGLPASFDVQFESKTTEACNSYADKCLAGTGLWIRDNDAYKEWTATKGQSSYPVLLVSGPSSSGKSCACALITKQLEGQKPEDRTYVANYFFPKKQSDGPNPLQVALKYMAFQIARVDPTVQDALYKACLAESNALRAAVRLKGLWEKLKVGTSRTGATYYLVFDGLDNLPPEHSKNLTEFIRELQVPGDGKSAGSVRVLASGMDDKFDAWGSSCNALWIKMEAQNMPDMRIVIEDKLKTQGMLQRPNPNSDQERAREMILEKLPNIVNGSYSSLLFRLDEVINLLGTRKTIKELESKLNESISSHEAAIKTLQRSLTLDEIKELNELLKWVLYSNPDRYALDLKQLEAAMFLDAGTQSLVTLEYVIKNKYPAILKIEDGYVYVQDLISADLTKINDSTAVPQQQESSISMTITVKNADEETCGNFLWDLAHQSNRERFKFDLNAINASRSSQAVIAVDEFKAHHSMLLKTFQFLEEEPNDQTSHFGWYLVCLLPHHLRRLLALEDPEKRSLRWHQKLEIGKKLYSLFGDNKLCERHMAAFYNTCSWWTVEEMKVVREWLTDSGVVRGITDKSWRDQVQQFNSPAKGYLDNFTKMTVEVFLRQRNEDAEAAFNWLQEIMAADEDASRKISNSEADQTTAANAPLSDTDTDTIDWDRISAWCQCFLELKEEDLDSLWYERLASFAFSRRYPYCAKDTVASLYGRALSKDNASWLCHRGLGETYARDQSFQSQGLNAGPQISDALEHMERALIEAKRVGAVPKPTSKDIVALLLLVGQYAEALGQMERAAECYAEASNSDDAEQAQEGQLGLLRTRLSGADSDETKEWLHKELTREGGEERIVQVLKKTAQQYDEHEAFILKLFSVASGDLDLWRVIIRAIETASPPGPALGQAILAQPDKDAMEQCDIDNETTGVLLYYRGMATYMYGKPSDACEPTGEALRLWKACRETLSTIKGSYNASIVRDKASVEIGRHLFQDMLDNDHADHIRTLEELANAEDEYDGDCAGFLGALYAARGESEQSKKVLMPRVRLGLQILSDETPDNDFWGFITIWNALVQNRSFENAAIARLLRSYPDPIAQALCNFGQEDCLVEGDGAFSQEELMEVVNQLASKTLNAVKSQVSAYSEQPLRVQAALKHVDSCLAGPASEFSGVGEAVGRPGEVESAAYNIIRAKLCAIQPTLTLEMNWRLYCNGRTKDGDGCTNPPLYHCIFCPDTDFCDECLEQLRHPGHGDLRTKGVCNSRHSWVKVPPPDSPMYVGPTATKVCRPRVEKQAENPNILEFLENPDDIVSVEEWKSELAKDWGIKLDIEDKE
ncbi:hypothetical protein N0V82_007910 [Gnomoniopsis sp. IMI 355080]|nr:hypothetical protein N0V82_007910 [Gnomoniopsis sp. IMI 355080]